MSHKTSTLDLSAKITELMSVITEFRFVNIFNETQTEIKNN